ncbi:MAG TPA: response regulator [Aggregatilineales bacterium]|nr:response regulator [Aggregatilineales bacterium]
MSGIVLLVEDDSELRKIWEMYLQPFGYEIHHAQNGLEALHLAQENRPDLVVLDLMMPTASGDLVLGFIRSTSELKDTPVLVVSAHQNIASLAEQYEADGFLKKPVNIDEFRDAVRTLMGSRGE